MTTTSRRLLFALPWALLAAIPAPARADNVLVYQTFNSDPQGGDAVAGEATTILQGLGHTVTNLGSFAPTLPANLSVFDAIYVVQLDAIGGAVQNALIDYVKAGGGLYLTGERSCCEAMNQTVENMVLLLTTTSPSIGAEGEGLDDFVANPSDPFGITTSPNAVPTWLAGQAGLMNNVPVKHQVFNQPIGKTGAAAWTGEDMEQGAGCLYVAMDLSFWMAAVHPEQDKPALIENIEQFLSTCGDSDGDGVSDEGELAAGTDPADPDSDGDGLCDGFGNVNGTCVAGESIYADTDNDGMIDPKDDDDDGDGISTAYELAAELLAPNVDGDNIPAWLDLDSDDNFISDEIEGEHDYNNNGIPSIVEDGDDPADCSVDADCGAADSGLVCNLQRFFCVSGCHTPGNGCPDGQMCTSSNFNIGDCVPGGEGGAGPGGGGPGGGSANGGNGQGGNGQPAGGGAQGGDSANGAGSANGGGAADGGNAADDDGCDCSTPNRQASGAGLSGLLALALLTLRRRSSRAAG